MRAIRGRLVLLALGTALILAACGNDSKSANKMNFENILNAHHIKMKQCVEIGDEPNSDGFIQEFRVNGPVQEEQLPFYEGLVRLGLLEMASYKKEIKTFSGQVAGDADWIGFKFSDLASTYLRPVSLSDRLSGSGARQLCYATPKVVRIANFSEPAEVMGVRASNVQYTYRLVDIAPWAIDPIVAEQFDWLPERLSNQNIQTDDDLVLTVNGWVHVSVLN